MKYSTTHVNKFLVELEKEQQEFIDNKNKKKKNITTMKQFGGLRLLGYVDQKPLIAQYKIDSNGFSMKFNQQIMDKEYAGSFNKKFLNSKLEVYTNGRLSAPLGTIPKRIKGGNTTIGTIAWIATLIEIENMKSEMAYIGSKISKKRRLTICIATFGLEAKSNATFSAKGKTSSRATTWCKTPILKASSEAMKRPVKVNSTVRERPSTSRIIQGPVTLAIPEFISG